MDENDATDANTARDVNMEEAADEVIIKFEILLNFYVTIFD